MIHVLKSNLGTSSSQLLLLYIEAVTKNRNVTKNSLLPVLSTVAGVVKEQQPALPWEHGCTVMENSSLELYIKDLQCHF